MFGDFFWNPDSTNLYHIPEGGAIPLLIMVTRAFQFKLLHNIIFCNDKLYLFWLTESNVCSFCRKEVETYRLIFFKCSEGSRIWNEVGNNLKMWIDLLLGFMFRPSPFLVCLCIYLYLSLYSFTLAPLSLSTLSLSLSCLASLLFNCSVSLCLTQLKLGSWI